MRKGFQSIDDGSDPKLAKNHSWSRMLARVYKIDVTKCVACGGEMVIVAAVTERAAITRYLSHVGIAVRPPPRGPPRINDESRQGEFDFDTSIHAPM